MEQLLFSIGMGLFAQALGVFAIAYGLSRLGKKLDELIQVLKNGHGGRQQGPPSQ